MYKKNIKNGVKLSHREYFLYMTIFGALCLTPSLSRATNNSIYNKYENATVSSTQQATVKVTGKVLDTNGEPLPGATIQVIGTPRGVTTDTDGSFSIECKKTDKLEISYLGMQSQTISVDKKTNFVITLEDQADQLEEVTVVAFAKQKKESVLGSVSTIKPAELKTTSSNLTTGFAGKLAGVIAYQRSGEPGQDNAEFFVRGITTFGDGSANPLILIDNVELESSDLSRLNPDDIASFSVLKDATATALYGARGANGVILVTTKEGQEGRAKLSFRIENSFSGSAKDVDIADPLTFMKLHNEAVRTRDPFAQVPYLESAIAAREEGKNPYVYPMVNWQDMLFKRSTTNQRANLNISGGGNVARYYIALTYAKDNGIMRQNKNNKFNNNINNNKYGVRTNVNIKLTKKTDLAVRVSGTFDSYQGPLKGGSDMYNQTLNANPVLFPATFLPDNQPSHIHAKHVLFGNYGEGGEYLNPYAEMCRGYKESENTSIIAQLELKQNLDFITKGLRARLMGNATRKASYDASRSYNPFWYSIGTYDKFTDQYILSDLNPDKGTDYLSFDPGSKNVESSIYMEASLSYDRKFKERHNISSMLVYTVREEKNANAGSLIKSLPKRNMGLAGRFTYDYDSRYLAEFNFGYNGSERFDKSHRWGFFPSGGLGWVVSNENFWQNGGISKVVNKLKLKGSYGLVGNDNIGKDRFFYLSQVSMSGSGINFGTSFNNGYSGVKIERYANPSIGWEVSHKLNVGFETTLFNDLEVNAEYFKERRTNILQERADIPSIAGFKTIPYANIGEAQGEGMEFSIDYNHSFNKNLWLTVRGNFTYATSKYTKYEEPAYEDTPWLRKTGRKLSQQEGYIAERLFIDEEDVKNSPKQTFGGQPVMAGDIKYKDINNDGLIDSRDKVAIGAPKTPEIIYGFGFSLGYRDFDFNCFFQGSGQSSFFISPSDISPFKSVTTDGKKGNKALLQFIADNHWSETNPNPYAEWPRLSAVDIDNNNQSSTWWLRDGTFLRLKSAEIGYTLPQKYTKKAYMQNFRVYVSGTNLLCFSNFKLWDTEMGGSGLKYPLQRVFNLGLQVTF